MNRTAVFIAVVAMVTVIIAGVIFAVLLGRDTGPIVGMLTVAVPMVIGLVPILLAVKEANEKISQQQEQLKTVAHLVNGNTSRMLSIVERRTDANGQPYEDELGEETVQRIRSANRAVEEIAEGNNGSAVHPS